MPCPPDHELRAAEHGANRMASITIRGLDDELKQRLRLRAARNGRSMEDEARTILRDMAGDRPPSGVRIDHGVVLHPRTEPPPDPQPATRPVLLIIGGGIRAYKSLDLI